MRRTTGTGSTPIPSAWRRKVSGAVALDYTIQRLRPGDDQRYAAMLELFGRVFGEIDTYTADPPGPAYRERLLANGSFVALVALARGTGDGVVGALAAYELPKFERERSEFYIYDLAVDVSHRRRGVATALIERTRSIAAECGAWVVMVQADAGDGPAIALYRKLGVEERVLHYDIRP